MTASRLVVFDLDGTLIDSRRDLTDSANALVVEKGSVTLDGVSLTVTEAGADRFAVSLIPHTLAVTTLGAVKRGDRLHLELDVLGKYVARAIEVRARG